MAKRRKTPKQGKPTRVKTVLPEGKKASDFSKAEKDYWTSLNSRVDQIYEEAKSQGLTWGKLAKLANLSPKTVERLGDRITRYPQDMTVYKLALAVGWNQEFARQKLKLKKAA